MITPVRGAIRILAVALVCLVAAPAAHAATLTYEGNALVLRAGGENDRVYLDDAYDPPDPSQRLRFDGSVTFTEVPQSCAQRQDSMVDCPVPSRVRVELGAGQDGFGILNQVSVELGELVVDGGDGNDSLAGDHTAPRRETLLGGSGDDRLTGHGGDDQLRGGPGDDTLDAGAGSDQVLGEDGNDEVAGDGSAAPGADVVDGGAGSDIQKEYVQHGTDVYPSADVSLDGQANDGRPREGDNVVSIERAIAYVNGTHVLGDGAEDWQVWANMSGGGTSSVRALGGDDRIVGEDGTEKIDGGTGADFLEGGRGHDTVIGGPGPDTLYGDDTDSSCNPDYPESCVQYGNDAIDARDGERDNVDCGAGTDRVSADALDLVAPNCEIVERGAGGSGDPGSGVGKGAARFSLVGSPRLAVALRRGLLLRLRGARPGKARIVARQGARTVAAARMRVPAGGRAKVRLRFTKPAARRLRRAKQIKLTVAGAGVKTTLRIKR